MAMSLKAPAARRWQIWTPGTPEEVLMDVSGPDAWVKGGHLFVGVQKTQEWTHAWAPGGWLSIELVESADEARPGKAG